MSKGLCVAFLLGLLAGSAVSTTTSLTRPKCLIGFCMMSSTRFCAVKRFYRHPTFQLNLSLGFEKAPNFIATVAVQAFATQPCCLDKYRLDGFRSMMQCTQPHPFQLSSRTSRSSRCRASSNSAPRDPPASTPGEYAAIRAAEELASKGIEVLDRKGDILVVNKPSGIRMHGNFEVKLLACRHFSHATYSVLAFSSCSPWHCR
jgi:hypothetical protein